jgi:hemerythrin
LELIRVEDAPSVGVAEIDDQHAALLELVNRLHRALTEGDSRELLATIITELIKHTHAHFVYEEQLMSRHHYPEYDKHKADHDRLMQHLTDLEKRFLSGDLLLSFAVMIDLKGWATVHIEKSDRPLGLFLQDERSPGA